MRNRFVTLNAAIGAVLVFSAITFAQRDPGFNPRDLSGVWERAGGDRGVNLEVPQMTPEGEARFNQNKPSYGRPLGSPLNGEHIGRVRAVPPAQGNSLVGECNPQGVPRLYFEPEAWEFIPIGDRMLQFFPWTHALREIWMDGRELPEDPAFGLRWFGYSAGEWEGNTFVITTVGTDDRTWLDHFGYPHSDAMRFEERFRRVDPDTLELNMRIDDPKTYTETWVAETKTFSRISREDLTFDGWYGFLDGICAPINELEFNEEVRDPAGALSLD